MSPSRRLSSAVVLALLLPAGQAGAATLTVKMLNKGADGQTMVFEPAFLKVAPGDSVTFVSVDKGHDSESVAGMVPDGAEPWKGKMSQDTTVAFQKPGLYGFKCSPHYAMGMVGLIQVGDAPSNLDAVKAVRQPPLAQKRFDEAVKQVGSAPAAK